MPNQPEREWRKNLKTILSYSELPANDPAVYDFLEFFFAEEIATREAEVRGEEIIICAAVRASDGYIYRGHRHGNALQGLHGMPAYESERPHGDDQGFVTSKNRYVNRKEAYEIFVKNGAVSADEGRHPMASRDELYSEDLY